MSRYRSKVVVIEAFRFLGSPDQIEDPVWAGEAIRDGRIRVERDGTPTVRLQIKTDEGWLRANVGDWVIKGTENELYPCRDSVFQTKYEPA